MSISEQQLEADRANANKEDRCYSKRRLRYELRMKLKENAESVVYCKKGFGGTFGTYRVTAANLEWRRQVCSHGLRKAGRFQIGCFKDKANQGKGVSHQLFSQWRREVKCEKIDLLFRLQFERPSVHLGGVSAVIQRLYRGRPPARQAPHSSRSLQIVRTLLPPYPLAR